MSPITHDQLKLLGWVQKGTGNEFTLFSLGYWHIDVYHDGRIDLNGSTDMENEHCHWEFQFVTENHFKKIMLVLGIDEREMKTNMQI